MKWKHEGSGRSRKCIWTTKSYNSSEHESDQSGFNFSASKGKADPGLHVALAVLKMVNSNSVENLIQWFHNWGKRGRNC